MFNEIIFRPLYNLLVGIIVLLPWADVGVAVIIFTVIVRLILFPFYKHSLLAQVRMKEVEPEINKIRAKYATDKQAQYLKVNEFYKAHDIHPFRSLLLPILQLPILLGMVSIFYQIIPTVHPDILYSFVHVPLIRPTFLGLDLTTKNIYLAVAAAVIQFLQLHFSVLARQQRTQVAQGTVDKNSTSAMMNSLNTQMKFFVPIVVFISIYWAIPAKFPQASSIVALYLGVSTLFTLGQELIIREKYLGKDKPQVIIVKK